MGIQKKISIIFYILMLWLGAEQLCAQTQNEMSGDKSNVKIPSKIPGSKAAKKDTKKDTGQSAVIRQDGAPVYEVPNFDAPVMEYMEQGKKATVSKKIYPGIGGLGAFYKIRIAPNVYGYITDIDVEPQKGKPVDEKSTDEDMGADATIISKELENPDPVEEEDANSVYLMSWLGVSLANYSYAETIAKKSKSAQTTFLGVKRSGPTQYMAGAPLDLELVFTTSAPDFYDDISSSTSGFMLLGNALMMIPFMEFKRGFAYYGIGFMMKYAKWSVKLTNQPGAPAVDSQELNIGLAGEAGVAYRLTARSVLRAEAKYFYEEEGYFGYSAAWQYKY